MRPTIQDGMFRVFRLSVAWLVLTLFAAGASASGSLSGKLDLPPAPTRSAPEVKGFTDRLENPLAPVRPTVPTSEMVVVFFGDDKPASPPQVVIELLGDSFSRRVAAVPAGTEVVIKNLSKTARTLVAAEDPKLVPQGPINPTGSKSFRVMDSDKVYRLGDADAPHLKLTLIGVNTPYYAYPDETGKFSVDGLPAGTYKVKIWYRDGWLERPDDTVDVKDKGKAELNPKITSFGASSADKKK